MRMDVRWTDWCECGSVRRNCQRMTWLQRNEIVDDIRDEMVARYYPKLRDDDIDEGKKEDDGI